MRNFPKRSVFPLGLCVTLAFALILLAPFGVLLEIHHELGAADYDGHQHSETDLCKWMQHHAAGSLLLGLPVVGSFLAPTPHLFQAPGLLRPVRVVPDTLSRAPPLS